MAAMQNLPTSLALLLFVSTASALHIRGRPADAQATPVAHLLKAAAPPIITPGPSPELLAELNFPRAVPTIPACATDCVASAVTKSTNCKLGDTLCECNAADVINKGAAPCVQSACGYVGAVQAQVAGEQLCISVLAGLIPGSRSESTPEATATNKNDDAPSQSSGSSLSKDPSSPSNKASPSASGATSGGSSGSSDGSSNGGNNGSSGKSGSADSDGSSGSGALPKHKKGLSGGAIAGIVVGAVAGIGLVVAAIWKFCLNKAKGGNAAAGGDGGTTAAAPAVAQVPPTQGPPVDHNKLTSTTPLSTPSELSNNPHTVSSISPFQGSAATTTPPIHPNAAELPHGSYPQPPAAYAYPPHPMGQAYHEVHAQPPEMAGSTHLPQELHGGGPVYEMGN
ncbi:uncharacterized protein TRIREDRAFT_122941 [Trichoderma reesei QM6a]|uniref:Predicted protein n=2 Tax=Hypocrea jecorina TaxID=51453 RepID=G0RPP0_HYPJQ|nr:uncharacterized protein TRIREDRAFT_122941 [Trichoderma reesei QM6a]EGR46781.1 predicted protein [Trichoderma reesei QM6a]ETS00483.1 hypothetical protein M419DRAFT_142047 [Trichoderma reesei RUT C-30]